MDIFGPEPVEGTLVSADTDMIFGCTGCRASTRARPGQKWGGGVRCLTVSGPAEKLKEATRMARDCIKANSDKVRDGISLGERNQSFKGTPARWEAGQACKAAFQKPKQAKRPRQEDGRSSQSADLPRQPVPQRHPPFVPHSQWPPPFAHHQWPPQWHDLGQGWYSAPVSPRHVPWGPPMLPVVWLPPAHATSTEPAWSSERMHPPPWGPPLPGRVALCAPP